MSIEQVKQQVQQLPPQAWQELSAWMMHDERIRREQESAKAELIQQLQEEGTIPRPEFTTMEQATSEGAIPAWVDPGTDHAKMYPEGAVITHNGKTWLSVTSALNSWEPGTENGLTWQELTTGEGVEGTVDTGVAEFVHPTGVHDAYQKGTQVTYNGAVYESLIDANVYSPTAYPTGWTQIS